MSNRQKSWCLFLTNRIFRFGKFTMNEDASERILDTDRQFEILISIMLEQNFCQQLMIVI